MSHDHWHGGELQYVVEDLPEELRYSDATLYVRKDASKVSRPWPYREPTDEEISSALQSRYVSLLEEAPDILDFRYLSRISEKDSLYTLLPPELGFAIDDYARGVLQTVNFAKTLPTSLTESVQYLKSKAQMSEEALTLSAHSLCIARKLLSKERSSKDVLAIIQNYTWGIHEYKVVLPKIGCPVVVLSTPFYKPQESTK